MFEYKRIYVAVDGSKESDYAFEKAMAICLRNNATLTAIHVIGKSYVTGLADYARNEVYVEEEKDAFNFQDHYESQARKYDLPFELKVKEGTPSSSLLHEFKALLEDDLVICGASNLNKIEEMLFGSVAKNIVSQSSCDVLVVKHPNK